jgi:hypothetical protein
MDVEQAWDELSDDKGTGPDNGEYELVIEFNGGEFPVQGIRWDHQEKRAVIET